MKDLNALAKKYIEGEWGYSADNNILKKSFATNTELAELHLINEEGFLDLGLKNAMLQILGETLLNQVVGPFGDSDIFSGDALDEQIIYNLEMHQVSDVTLQEVQKISNVVIKSIKIECDN